MDLEHFLLGSGAIRFGEFTLASGKKSSYYVDIKKAATHPDFLRGSAVRMKAMLPPCDRIAGVELGAVPLAVALSLETGIPYIIVRKRPKSHGTSGLIEGDLEKDEKVLFVEDVTTTGGSLIKGVAAVRKAGGIVSDCFVVVDREEGASEALSEHGVNLIPLVRISRLLAERTGGRE